MKKILMSTGVFLLQYLVGTYSTGYFLALSGGLDSCTAALFIFEMARLVLKTVTSGEGKTLAELRRVMGNETFYPSTPHILSPAFSTLVCYMETENSSAETRSRAKRFKETIGAYHSDISINEVIHAHELIVEKDIAFKPKHAFEEGSRAENVSCPLIYCFPGYKIQ